MNPSVPSRIDRRLAIKWMLAAGAGALVLDPRSFAIDAPSPSGGPAPLAEAGYGLDPDMMKPYKPGDLWPLTFSDAERRDVSALCDVIIPAEGDVPSASAVGVTDFIDEWVSAPYPNNVADRGPIMKGLAWLDKESKRRLGAAFADATGAQRLQICEDIAKDAPANSELEAPSRFFKRFRNLTATGFFTTPIGMKDLGYVGNVPLARFDGPPADLVAKLGLTDEVKW